jgi:hypothetical protein
MWYRPTNSKLLGSGAVVLGLGSILASVVLVQPAEAQNQARPKITEAKALETGTERLFRAIDEKIERRHALVFEPPTPREVSCIEEDYSVTPSPTCFPQRK